MTPAVNALLRTVSVNIIWCVYTFKCLISFICVCSGYTRAIRIHRNNNSNNCKIFSFVLWLEVSLCLDFSREKEMNFRLLRNTQQFHQLFCLNKAALMCPFILIAMLICHALIPFSLTLLFLCIQSRLHALGPIYLLNLHHPPEMCTHDTIQSATVAGWPMFACAVRFR